MTPSETTILYFGNDWFAENRTSSHHVARELSKSRRVIYVECPGLRAPRSTSRDFAKVFRILWKLCKCLVGGTQVAQNVTVVTLPQIPLHRFAFVRALNQALSRL